MCLGGEIKRFQTLDCAQFFDSVSSTWTLTKSLPYPVCGAGLSSGDIHSNFLRRVHRYDLDRDLWSEVAPMQYDRNGHSIVALNHRIYAVGGTPSRTVLQAVEQYDPSVGRWGGVADLPVRLYRPAAVAYNGHLYASGGLTSGGSTLSTTLTLRYDPQAHTWSELASMPTARFWYLACVGPNGLIYVIGR
ncbi:kelch-like protein diablo [Paramacrobiotus metropolitanus]|uniref:kelch-like protein diablo n=1 Tax=Paramacrobiotus metropolitanus TaxID=2943436 RepID=UPI002446190F|nr:kelch-like protein diablo [Paramacrobiotus metropolitanus]